MSDPIETFDHNGLTVKMYQDEIYENPIKDEELVKFAAFHRNYDLSNTDWDRDDFIDFLKTERYNLPVCLPLYLYDHSGLSISTGREYPFNCQWDSSHIGFVYVTKEDLRRYMCYKVITKKRIEEARKLVLANVETFDQYLRGEVYSFVIEDEDENHIDSCGGFFGWEYAVEQAKEAADAQEITALSE